MRPCLLLWIAVLLLAACLPDRGAPPPGGAQAEAAAAPGPDLTAALAAPPGPGLARIVFYRQAIPFLQAISPDLIVNGKRVGTADLGRAFLRDARPGGYEVFSTHDPDSVAAFTLGPGETRFVKVGPQFQGLGFRLSAREVPAAQARAELDDLELARTRFGG
jgi:hypothetical protein